MTDITLEATEEIHANVREHYAERARNVGSSCCGPSPSADSCCGTDPQKTESDYVFYSADEVAGIAEEAVQGSFGCGNPTALASLKPSEDVVNLGSGGGIDVFLAAR